MNVIRNIKIRRAQRIDRIVNFNAHTRNEWVAEKARSIEAGARVLDVGAGQCQYQSLFSHCDYKTQDFAQYAGTRIGPSQEAWNYGTIDYVSDITSIPVEDGSFDVILCTEVLEHVADPISALREFRRILRPGGRLLLSAPLGSGLHQEPFHFYGGFTPHFYRKYLGNFDFEVVEIRAIGGLFKHVCQETHRIGQRLPYSWNPKILLLKFLLSKWLPAELFHREEGGRLIEEFTVGYLVEGRRKD